MTVEVWPADSGSTLMEQMEGDSKVVKCREKRKRREKNLFESSTFTWREQVPLCCEMFMCSITL